MVDDVGGRDEGGGRAKSGKDRKTRRGHGTGYRKCPVETSKVKRMGRLTRLNHISELLPDRQQ